MSDGTAVPVRRKLSSWQRIVFGIFVGVLALGSIFVFVNLFEKLWSSGSSMVAHDGPSKMITIGVNRFQSCKYAGNFLGGAGFDCIVKNISVDEYRAGDHMFCAGFDDQNRMIRSADRVGDLYSSVLAPGEEHIVRIYLPQAATASVCTDSGSLGSPVQLQKLLPDLRKDNLVQEIDI
ncbi:hypothetical protein [Dyella sedimenti]|uniref:hypothetical protein n=1 Tax=Dyella sedimenti TaxID=2919947 RepID=UPI001FA974F0|nr:hypothetical protein [Dyella sedimenti]